MLDKAIEVLEKLEEKRSPIVEIKAPKVSKYIPPKLYKA